MQTILNEIRYTFRQLVKSPGFTATAILTLALGIGANTSIFTLVHAVMLKSLPVADPKQLYQIGHDAKCCIWGGFQDEWTLFSYPLYQHLRANTPAFEQVAAFQGNEPEISVRRTGTSTPAIPLHGEFVSGNYFATFGLNAFAGRVFVESDDTPNSTPVAVISYHTWQQKFGLDSSVVGGIFQFDGKPFTVIGVAPPGFYGDRLRNDPPDFYLPLHQEPILEAQSSDLKLNDSYWLYAIGRMKPGYSAAQVGAQMTAELQHWLPEHVSMAGRTAEDLSRQHILLGPGGAGITSMRETFKSGLFLLVAASALVLFIACANLANLLMARSTARNQRAALQLALGASRSRLIRGLLVESLLLSFLGGIAGLIVAYEGTRGILLVAFHDSSYLPIDASPSLPVLSFSFALSVFTGVLFGIVPAWLASKANPAEALRGANRSTRDSSALPQKALVIFQAAFSLVLLAAAGLVTKSLNQMERGNYGFEPNGRLIVSIDPLIAGYKPEQLPALYRRIEDRLREVPNVKNLSFSTYSPQDGDGWNKDIAIAGRPPQPARNQISAGWLRISPHYFETIGTALLRGRSITDQDTATSERVAVIDEAFAKKFFPGQDPIGQHFGAATPGHSGDFTIVGMVKTTRYQKPLDDQNPMFFLPLTQSVMLAEPHMEQMDIKSHYIRNIELQVAGVPESIGPAVRNILASIDPNLTVIEMKSFNEQIAAQFNQERLTARLTEMFSLLALLLASIGLYGVTSYNVNRRTSEIGIRMALGANRNSVVGMVLRGAMIQIGIGLAIGVPFALLSGRAMSSQLYGVQYTNPLAVLLPIGVLFAAGLIAGLLPARRAASIEPVKALRSE